MFKRIFMGVLCIMMAFPLVGCDWFNNDPGFALDSVIIQIKQEYQQEFENEEFTIEDFIWDNVESISYGAWYANASEPYGSMTIYLKEHGKTQVLDAIDHFETLDFIKHAEAQYFFYEALS